MEIRIEISNKDIKISLWEKKKTIDYFMMPDERDLGERLIVVVDNLLQKNGIQIGSIKKVRIMSDQGDSYTTTRIAKTFARIWNMAVDK